MKSTIEEVNAVQRRVKVDIAEDAVSEAFNLMYQDIRKKAEIKGFRKGKAPMAMIRKMYGDAVAGDVFQKLIQDNLFGAIEENQLRPVAQPVIETTDMPKNGEGYSFSAIIDVMPPLNIDGYKDLSCSIEVLELNDDLVNEELGYIARQKAKTKPVEDGAVVGDGHMITMSHTATLDGENLAQMEVKDAQVEIGAKQLLEDLETAFRGMKVGESKDVDVTLPENYGDKDLANKTLKFNISVSDVKEVVLPEMDDELAKDLGMETLDELKNNIQQRLEHQLSQSKRQQIEGQLMDQILNKNEFEVPPSIVDQVIDSMIGEMGFQNDKEKKNAMANKDLRDRCRDQAKRRAQNTLALLEIAEKEKIQVTDDDIDDHIKKMVPSGSDEIKPDVLANMRQSLAPQLKENLIFEKTMNFIIDSAKVAEVPAKR